MSSSLSISIITPTLNRADMLHNAILSVLAQNDVDSEHIIVDGGSADGTIRMLESFPHLRVIHGRDKNLYDAINKGVAASTGQILGFLNSDDEYAPRAFDTVRRLFAKPEIDMVVGGAAFFQPGKPVLRVMQGERCVGLNAENVINNVTLMNCCFFRRSLVQMAGGFDDRFPIAADKDFWMRLLILKPRHIVIPDILYRYREHEGSITFSDDDTRLKLARSAFELTQTRLREKFQTAQARMLYLRWHAWAAGYYVVQLGREQRTQKMFGAVKKAFATDALWPVRFAARLPLHLRDMGARRGTRIKAHI